VAVQRTDWQADTLPAHLRMRFLLVDEHGAALTSGRSFGDLLRSEETASVRQGTGSPALPPVRAIGPEDLDTIEAQLPLTDPAGRVIGLFFPALKVDELRPGVQLLYVDNQAQSRRQNRLGLQFLYGQAFTKEMAALRKLVKAALTSHSASWLTLGAKVAATELRAQLLAFVLDAVFATAQGELPSRAEFETVVARAGAKGVLRTATVVLDQVLDTLQQRRAVSTKIRDWAARAKTNRNYQQERHQEYLTALDQIVPATFLHTLAAGQLLHKPRYLQALGLRIDRAEHSPQKDSKKAERLATPLARLRQLADCNNPSRDCQICQQEYGQLLEEFRVSIFAPELGTAQPVSEQRLLQKWQEVEAICRRVE